VKTFGIPVEIINLVQEMYRGFSCGVEINGSFTEIWSEAGFLIIAHIISYGAGHHNEKNNRKRVMRYILEF
jgi:hypothetical protein